MKKIIKAILIIICICLCIFFAYKIYSYLAETKESKDLNNELVNIAVTKTPTEIANVEENKNIPPIKVNFKVLKSENKDIVAWIFSENTPINYPIVQSYDNNYYLRRLLNGKYNITGTIFMDYRNNSEFMDSNTIIYGHNMKDDTMFGTLLKYKDQNYYEDHKIMYLFTEEKSYKLELFAGYTLSANSNIYNVSAASNSSNIQIAEKAKEKSTFKSDIKVQETDHIVTLSTCSYEYDEARFVVMGVLRSLEEA